MAESIRVLLVDDCEPIRIGIRRAFARANRGGGGVQIIGETGDGASALSLLESLNPQVVLIDGRLPDLCGYEIIERAREHERPARFIAYSAYEEYEDVMNLLRVGAAGFIVKDESIENLLHAIFPFRVVQPFLIRVWSTHNKRKSIHYQILLPK